jgi:hypothetical protein
MLIPVNIKLKHWILACIDFEQKWIAWFDSISEAHEQETRLLFTWLTRKHSLNKSTIFDPAEWSLHSGPPPGMQVPLQSNDYDCGIFICLYAAFLDIRLSLSFSQHDTRNVRTWMAHEMITEGKLLKMSHSVLHDNPLATATGNSETSSDNSMASKRSSESQLQGDIKRQKTYELEASEEKKNVQAAAEFWDVMRHTHGFQHQATGPQVQATAANEVAPSTELGTSSRQQAEAFLERQGDPKRRRESDEEYTDTTSQIIGRPTKRNKEFTDEHAKTNTTATPHGDTPAGGSGDAALLTKNEAEKSVLANATFSSIVQTTHGLQSRAGEADEVQRQKSPTTPPSQTIHGDLVRRDTTTFGVLVGRETIVLTPIEGYATVTPHTHTPKKYKKPRSGSDKKQKPTGSYKGRQLP